MAKLLIKITSVIPAPERPPPKNDLIYVSRFTDEPFIELIRWLCRVVERLWRYKRLSVITQYSCVLSPQDFERTFGRPREKGWKFKDGVSYRRYWFWEVYPSFPWKEA